MTVTESAGPALGRILAASFAAGVVLAAFAASARAGEPPILDLPVIQERCGPELARYCTSTPTSESEAFACLSPHWGELSGTCFGGFVSHATRRFAWRDVCRVDLSRFCLTVQQHDRAALQCLAAESWRLDPHCRGRLDVAAVWTRRIMERLEWLWPRDP